MQTELAQTEQMLWKVPFPSAALFPHLMGKVLKCNILSRYWLPLCLCHLLAAVGSETEMQFACRLQTAPVLYLHAGRGQKRAQNNVKNDCTNILGTAEAGEMNPEERGRVWKQGFLWGSCPVCHGRTLKRINHISVWKQL